MPTPIPTVTLRPEPPVGLEERVAGIGRELRAAFDAVLQDLPEGRDGPQALAAALSLDKVLTSRLLKALRSREPIAVAYHVPGPEPMRRFCRAARKRGADAKLVDEALAAVERFQNLIRSEIGDRSALDTVISAWLPEARDEFELRRKQAAYRAMSQLRGVSVGTRVAAVLLHPSAEGDRIDLVWVMGLYGLQRLRPGATAKLSTRRMGDSPSGRRPYNLAGEPIDGPAGPWLNEFCHAPPAELEVRATGERVHYCLGGEEFGARSSRDLVFAEVNRSEIPMRVPRGNPRKGHMFVSIAIPCRHLHFDVLVHEDVYPGRSPELFLYDTAIEGLADVNDRERDLDRLDFAETIQPLGRGAAALRAPDVPNYPELLRHVFDAMSWDEERFRAWRCRIEYPVYGSQVVAAFDAPME